jgi:hypothetical protein
MLDHSLEFFEFPSKVFSIPHFLLLAIAFTAQRPCPAAPLNARSRFPAVAFQHSSAYHHIELDEENAMAQEPLATKGNYLHIYDFRVTAGHEEEFIRLFEEFDY